jgi:hypothetical protein
MDSQKVLSDYNETYFKLYRRQPSELRDLGDDWVLVNGARMTTDELQALTVQLQKELVQAQNAKRTIVKRLLKWFSAAPADA